MRPRTPPKIQVTIPKIGPRQAVYDAQVRPLAGVRVSLGALHATLAEPEAVLDDRAVAGIRAAGTLIAAYGTAAVTTAAATADKRWLQKGKVPKALSGPAFDVLHIAGLVSRAGAVPASFGQVVTQLMFGSDPTTALFRDVLLGESVPEDTGVEAPDPSAGFEIPFAQLAETPCVSAVQTALTQISVATSTVQKPQPRAGAVITSITPRPASPGETIILRGASFGTSDPSTALMFGTNRGTTVVWNDTEIHALVPQLQGQCCVSIVEHAVAAGSGYGPLLGATAQLSATLGECFGAAGTAAAGRFGQIPTGLVTVAATCQPDGLNSLWVGPPHILELSANGDASGGYVWRPHQPLTIRWNVQSADSMTVTSTTEAGSPPASMAPSVPGNPLPSGSQSFPSLDSIVPWSIQYTLQAKNRCGTSTGHLQLQFQARLGVVAVSGGLRCSFQMGALEAMGGLIETEPTVYGATGFGALSVRAAAANFRSTAALQTFWSMFTTPDDFFADDSTVDRLSTIDSAKYKSFLDSAHESSAILALGFGSRAGSILTIPDVPYGQIWWQDGMALAGSVGSEVGGAVASDAADAVLGASESASESFPWAALVMFALRVGVDIGVATDTRNKIVAAVGERGIKDPSGLMAAVDSLVTAAGAVKSGVMLRIALGNLESGDVNYANEAGTIVDQPSGTVVAAGALSDVLKASASTPSWLPPVTIGSNNFVDGATVDPAPVDAILDAAQADHIFILQPNARFLVPVDSFDSLGFVLVERRALQMRERGFLSAAFAPHERFPRKVNGVPVVGNLGYGVDLIEATIDLTGMDAFMGDNGLVAIYSDYGYMRAFDVLGPQIVFPDPSQADQRAQLQSQLEANSDNLTAARYWCWSAEHEINGVLQVWTTLSRNSEIVPISTSDPVNDMRSTKRSIRAMIDQRLHMVHDAPRQLGGTFPAIAAVPGNYADWFMKWEQHYWKDDWNIIGASPWTALQGFGDGTEVTADTPPAAIDTSLLQP